MKRMYKTLIIIGAGGHGNVCADIAFQTKKWKHIYFLDDNIKVNEKGRFEIVGKVSDFKNYISFSDFFIAIGDNEQRMKITDFLVKNGVHITKIIHPSAIISSNSTIEYGSVIMPGVIINNNTIINRGCIINTGSTIDHDNIIEEFVHISPGSHLAGNVKIGKKTWLGIGTIVINNVNITDNCIIGAGAVVIETINDMGKYVGIPAKKIN